MGDMSLPEDEPYALANGETPRSSPCPVIGQTEEQLGALTSKDTDVLFEAMGVHNTVASEAFFAPGSASIPAYVEQAAPYPFTYTRVPSPPCAQKDEATSDAHPDDTSWVTAETSEPSVTLNTGKGRARSHTDLGQVPQPFSSPSSLVSDDQPRVAVPGLVLTIPSGRCTIPQSSASATTHQSMQRSKQIYGINQGHDDYPHIHGPRSINRRGALHYQWHANLPRPRSMRHHRHVTSYAGEPLFRLCRSVPYILGTRALVTRLQLIVETPSFLPNEAEDFLSAKDIDITSLENYDLALINILCCLWND